MSASPDNTWRPKVRESLRGLHAYTPGEQPSDPSTIKLNTNEFPYPAAGEVLHAIQCEATDRVRVYPNPTSTMLRRRLAERYGVDAGQIIVGNGSDEILRLLVHGFGGPGHRLAVVEPTYSLYPVLAAQFETALDTYPLDGQTDLPEALFEAEADICMLALPNPPLGSQWSLDQLRRLAAKQWLLVLDGAYVDFAGDDPARELLREFPNVVLTRTFSKSAGLAGMRVGYMIGDSEVMAQLEPLRDSYNVNRVSQAAALAALESRDYYAMRCEEIVATREYLTEELSRRGFEVPDSGGNFVFARHARSRELYAQLKKRGILVRYFDRPGLENGLRITIGTAGEIDVLIQALDGLLAEAAS